MKYRWLAALLLALPPMSPAAGNEPAPPNVVVFITDDESWLERGIHGWPGGIPTPHFDRVAREGVLFNRAYCSAPSCAPARATLLTGRNFWELEQGAYIQAWLPRKFPVVPALLEAAGYRTGYTGKGYGPSYTPEKGQEDGFDGHTAPSGQSYQRAKIAAPEAETNNCDYAGNLDLFLDGNKDGRPFWFWVGCTEPHSGFGRDNPEKLAAKYGITLEQIQLPGFLPDTPGLRRYRASVLYEILHADASLGKVLEVLEKRGALENTLLIVTGDNGTAYSPHGKATAYDWGTHVPLAIRWPSKVKGGRIVDDFVSFRDLAPTMLEAAHRPVPKEMSGQSLLPILLSDKQGQVDPSRDFMVTGLEWHGELPPHNRASRTFRDARFAYIRNYADGVYYEAEPLPDSEFEKAAAKSSQATDLVAKHPTHPALRQIAPYVLEKRPPEELYDLEKDPWQLNNLANNPEYATAKESLKKRMEAYQKQTGDPRATGDMKIFDETRRFVEKRKAAGYKD